MRFLAFFGRHPWLRTGLLLLAAAAVLYGAARLWTSGPDAVHITITHVDGHDGLSPATKTVTYDRTIHDGAVAQRLQRDLATMPIETYDPFAAYSCPRVHQTYDAYTLTWSRVGLPVEHASADRTGCADWQDDIVFFAHRRHWPKNADALYADIAAAIALPTTEFGQPGWAARPASVSRSDDAVSRDRAVVWHRVGGRPARGETGAGRASSATS